MTIHDGAEAMTLRANLPDTTVARDAVANIRAGILTGLSVEMSVLREEWRNEATERTIHAAVLAGVALVDSPAYPQSSIEARQSYLLGRRSFQAGIEPHPFGIWYL